MVINDAATASTGAGAGAGGPNLLSIPLELRQQIYSHITPEFHLVFEVHPKTFHNLQRNYKAPFWIHLPQTYTSLVLTCRQLHTEFSPCIQNVTRWVMKGDGAIDHFTKYASKDVKKRITHLKDVNTGQYNYVKQLKQFPNCRSVEIRFRHAYVYVNHTSPEDLANTSFEDLLQCVSSAGLDTYYAGGTGVMDMIKGGRYDKYLVKAGIYRDVITDVTTRQSERLITQCTLDLIAETVQVDDKSTYNFTEKMNDIGFAVWSAFVSEPATEIAQREHDVYENDAAPLQRRYAKLLGAKPVDLDYARTSSRSKRQKKS